jgi:hypothetical protein
MAQRKELDHDRTAMIDLLALAVPHFVMAIAVWRLVRRADLDEDPAVPRKRPRTGPSAKGPGQ